MQSKMEKTFFIGLIAFLGLLILSNNSKLTNNFYYAGIMLPAIILFYRNPVRPTLAGMAISGYLLYLAASTLWSKNDISTSLQQLKYVLYVALFLFATHKASTSETRIKTIAICCLSFSLCVEVHALYILISDIGIRDWISTFPRLTPTLGPLNAIFVALTIGMSGFLLILMTVKNPWLASALVFLIILITLPLQSRALILSLVIAHCYYLYKIRAFSVLCLWLASIISAAMFLLLSIERFSATHRLDIWLFALNAWLDDCSLLFGCGNRYDFNININDMHFYHVHSIWLSQLVSGGISGLILITCVIFSIKKETRHIEKHWPPVFLFSFIACFTVGHKLLSHPDYIWLITWLPLGLSGILFTHEKPLIKP